MRVSTCILFLCKVGIPKCLLRCSFWPLSLLASPTCARSISKSSWLQTTEFIVAPSVVFTGLCWLPHRISGRDRQFGSARTNTLLLFQERLLLQCCRNGQWDHHILSLYRLSISLSPLSEVFYSALLTLQTLPLINVLHRCIWGGQAHASPPLQKNLGKWTSGSILEEMGSWIWKFSSWGRIRESAGQPNGTMDVHCKEAVFAGAGSVPGSTCKHGGKGLNAQLENHRSPLKLHSPLKPPFFLASLGSKSVYENSGWDAHSWCPHHSFIPLDFSTSLP